MPGSADRWAALDGHAAEVAPTLLGSVLRHEGDEGVVAVRLTEVEAYQGPEDPGSHAHRGPTERNRVMFGASGHLYVYRIYGMHDCANVVCSPAGTGAGILLRAGEVVEGIDLARSRRPAAKSDLELARGPARLVTVLGIDRSHGGTDLRRGPLRLDLADGPSGTVRTGPRVGLRLAADFPWRFWLDDEPTVSAYRPAAPRRQRP